MVREEYAVVCTCGITLIPFHSTKDNEKPELPRKIIIRCNRCGRIRFMLEETGGEMWSIYNRYSVSQFSAQYES